MRRLVTGKPAGDGAVRHSECDRQRLSLHLLLPGIYSLLVSTTRRVLGSLLTSHVHVHVKLASKVLHKSLIEINVYFMQSLA